MIKIKNINQAKTNSIIVFDCSGSFNWRGKKIKKFLKDNSTFFKALNVKVYALKYNKKVGNES